ncbi:Bug family tripartite tricarboxylate transporter substrate binding protein [Pseudorhodoferax sp.]|uniref:Bug family tripartite tricarboxylate transporter substrate binding protein n=1 Tax=Pseudorhodoferax sp. TaxID=1993553 RepID=UPI002DD64024|nr:tripartite tricarboxylate transporter substrate binding protein [Pseudorhodoferax sp.]
MFEPTSMTRRACLSLGLSLPLAGLAQAPFPSRPLRIISPFVAGGANDVLSRLLAQGMAPTLGQPVIVENKAGAGGIIGVEYVAKSPPDGYTILMTTSSAITSYLGLYRALPYDPRKDLQMISDVAYFRFILAVNPSVPANDVQELLALLKAQPKKYAIGSWGNGTPPHQLQAFLAQKYGAEAMHVAYKGDAQLNTDVMAGTIHIALGSSASLMPLVASGRMRALGVSGAARLKNAPAIRTFGEQGYDEPAFANPGPFSLMVAAGTPDAVVERLGSEVRNVLSLPATRSRIEELGATVVGNTPEEATAAYKAYLPIALKLTRDTGVTLD